MTGADALSVPAACPACGERQNEIEGGLDAAGRPKGPVRCMACGRVFSDAEYVTAVNAARAERSKGTGLSRA